MVYPLEETFMKNTIKVLGIIALVAVIGFTMTACDPEKDEDVDKSTTSGRLTITGLTSYQNKEISSNEKTGGNNEPHVPSEDTFKITKSNTLFDNNVLIVKGDSVTFYVWKEKKSYSGNDQVDFYVGIRSTSGNGDNSLGIVTANFTDGVAEARFVPNNF
jgi:hypothetical protein